MTIVVIIRATTREWAVSTVIYTRAKKMIFQGNKYYHSLKVPIQITSIIISKNIYWMTKVKRVTGVLKLPRYSEE